MAIRPIAVKHFLLRFSVHVCQEHYGVVDATVMPTLKEVLARFKLPEVKRKAVLTPRESPKKRLRAELLPNRPPGYWGQAQQEYRLFDSWRAAR